MFKYEIDYVVCEKSRTTTYESNEEKSFREIVCAILQKAHVSIRYQVHIYNITRIA